MAEIEQVMEGIPFPVSREMMQEDYPGFTFGMILWQPGSNGDVPPYWSPARDQWLRNFVENNGPLKAVANTFINKIVTIPWSINAHDRSIARHVKRAAELQKSFRRTSGSMSSSPIKGFKEAFKMFWRDYLTQDNGAFMLIMGDGRADGPVVGAPWGVLHLDSALCTRTSDPEYPVKYLHSGRGGNSGWYKIHYTRIIEMSNMPSANIYLNGVGTCAVSCCLEAAQELWDIYKYSSEMFGSRPPRQILYAETGATVNTLEQAIAHWNMKLDNENRSRFGGTLIAAPGKSGQELRLKLLNLSQMPENFNRRDSTTINMSSLAAAFGLDLRDVAYTLGAPSRTGDAEVQDRKGRGKGVGEALETFTERFNELCLGDAYFIRFDYLDDEQDEQQANIRQARSEARQRDLVGGLTTIRVEREFMLESGEISQENFADMELADGRLPDGLDVLLLFQSQDTDFEEWLDLGVSDPTNVSANGAEEMIGKIHAQQILVSEYIHLQTVPDRRRKGRQGLAALEKLRLMYEAQRQMEIQQEAAEQQMSARSTNSNEESNDSNGKSNVPNPAVQPGRSPTGKESAIPPTVPVRPGSMVNGNDLVKETGTWFLDGRNIVPATAWPPAALAEMLHNDLHYKEAVLTKQAEEIAPLLEDYGRQFRNLVDTAAEGELPRDRFEDLLAQIVFATLLAIWLRGAHKADSEVTPDEWRAIFDEAEPHYQSIRGIADDVYGGRYAANIQAAYTRIEGWLNMAEGFFFYGQTYRRDDPFLRWVYSVEKEHCRDCARLDGQVHPASEWRARNLRPRWFGLECRGIHCGCRFEQTNGPARGDF